MLEAYWKLTGPPFDKSIKAEQLFFSNSVTELFSRLEYLKQRRGLMLLTGLPGTGKTTALRAFTAGLTELSYKSFYVPLATVNVLDFYRQLNRKLGGEASFYKTELFASIQQRIQDLVTHNKNIPVLVFDEAHLLKNENFTELQILTNFKMDSTDPAIIILAGQSHLADRLMRPILQAFYQRIILKYHLLPLEQAEIGPFISHHLALKGCQQSPFAANALEAIFKNSAGIPRTVATLARHTLTVGMFQKAQILTEEHVFQASQELWEELIMLYFGVHFARLQLKITALSQGFAVIDVLNLSFLQAKQVQAWANALKNCPEEPTQWFIDEHDFYQPDYPTEIFQFQDHTNTVFLVNHRALCELMQFSQELTAVVKNASALPPADFFLASAIRLFHENHCKQLTPAARPG